jgi:hypothetical protein
MLSDEHVAVTKLTILPDNVLSWCICCYFFLVLLHGVWY